MSMFILETNKISSKKIITDTHTRRDFTLFLLILSFKKGKIRAGDTVRPTRQRLGHMVQVALIGYSTVNPLAFKDMALNSSIGKYLQLSTQVADMTSLHVQVLHAVMVQYFREIIN